MDYSEIKEKMDKSIDNLNEKVSNNIFAYY